VIGYLPQIGVVRRRIYVPNDEIAECRLSFADPYKVAEFRPFVSQKPPHCIAECLGDRVVAAPVALVLPPQIRPGLRSRCGREKCPESHVAFLRRASIGETGRSDEQ
jgi:hypothetical protein